MPQSGNDFPKDEKWEVGSLGYELQVLDMLGLSGTQAKPDPGQYAIRHFTPRSVLPLVANLKKHNQQTREVVDLDGVIREDTGPCRCSQCKRNISELARPVKVSISKPEEDGLRQGDGVDEGGDASPAPDNWWDRTK